jgi:hypothetical protein
LGNPVFHAVSKFVRLRFNSETLDIGKGAEKAKALKGGTKFSGGVAEARKNL